MKILALETSAKACSAAVVEDGSLLATAWQATSLTHSRTLMPMVEAMLCNSELSMADMGAVAVAVGPGSFTGIRIGVAAAKGLAWARELPCAPISTLEAMALGLAHMEGALVVCAMDARRAQVYNALFAPKGGGLVRLTPDRGIALEDLARELSEDPRRKLIVGDGAALCRSALEAQGVPCSLAPPHLVLQSAVGVGLAAEQLAERGGLVSAQDLVPVYLRPPLAERLRQKNERM